MSELIKIEIELSPEVYDLLTKAAPSYGYTTIKEYIEWLCWADYQTEHQQVFERMEPPSEAAQDYQRRFENALEAQYGYSQYLKEH